MGGPEPLEVVSPYLRGTRLLLLTGDSTGLHRLVTAFALFTLHSVLTQSV